MSERKIITALVTGGAGGIGSAICRRLAADGYFVAVNYNSGRERAERLASEIGGVALKADVADAVEVAAMIEKFGAVDVLVNNAGVADYGLFQLTTAEQRARVFAVNIMGAMNCAAAVLPEMLRAQSGCIVNISSIWGEVGASCEVVYSASKAALIGFSKALAREVEPSGIRVSYIAPGVIDTPMNARFTREELAEVGPIGTPEDVAEAVAAAIGSE
jgi:3-oxoacyl-[acyl-carrier protein] reductase